MTSGADIRDQVRAALLPHGLFVRGIVLESEHPDLMPEISPGLRAKTIVLIGAQGGSNWSAFRQWQRNEPDAGILNPLDSWSKVVLTPISTRLGASVWFPSDPPWQPFQRWAMAAEGLKPSPLGILIHPEFGLWHSYRGAFGFDFEWTVEQDKNQKHPCAACLEKPCLNSCPVGAVSENDFDLAGCRTHLKTAEGQSGCMQSGCVARNACPVGNQYRYSDDQLKFHMAALG